MKPAYIATTGCLLMILAAAGALKAQSETDTVTKKVRAPQHEIALYGAGGLSSLNYTLNKDGHKSDGTGAIGGIGYTWNINYHLGIVTGMEVTGYSAEAKYDAISMEREYGRDKDKFNFKYSMNNYIESHNVTFISIPVMLQYSVPLSGSAKFYLSGGGRIGLPIHASASIYPGNVTTLGYYYFENQTYTDLLQYGFVHNLNPGTIKTDIDVTVMVAASLETGARFFITDNILIYTAIYIDYGLNSIRSTQDRDLINYQEYNPSELKYASVLNTPHVNKVKVLGTGLKVKISFGW
jgi:hypothetical protein